MTEVHPATKALAMQLGAAFAQIGADCIPAIEKYLREATDPKEVSFGCRVRFWTDKEDTLRAQLIPATPKLPTLELDNYDFTLAWQGAQLAFVFVGDAPPQQPAQAAQPAQPAAPEIPAIASMPVQPPASMFPNEPAQPPTPMGAPQAQPEPSHAPIRQSDPNPGGNGADPEKPPLPAMVGGCPTTGTAEHAWRPLEDQPGVYFCMCGARARDRQPSDDAPQA